MFAQEKAPTLIDPAGPTISLISSEPVFVMAAALNACGYNEGLDDSAPVRKHIRDEMDQALAHSEDARARRDALCLYIAQHRMTGTRARHRAVHLAGPLPDAAARARAHGRPHRDAARLHPGGRDRCPFSARLWPLLTCTASGLRRTAPTTMRPTCSTILCRR